jgi:hypothetical protein
MAHALFLILHLAGVLFAWVLLFVTVPLHLIYLLLQKQRPRPTPASHVICPQCRELVRKDARLCKHCGTRLIPQ